MPPNKNSLPACVKPRIAINPWPTYSKIDFTKSIFKTPIAIISWKSNPIPTVFQLIALRLLLNKNAIKIKLTIPKAPLQKLVNENPWLGIILSTLVSNRATLSSFFGTKLKRISFPEKTRVESVSSVILYFSMELSESLW